MGVPIEIDYESGFKLTQFEINRINNKIKSFLKRQFKELEKKLPYTLKIAYCTIALKESQKL